MKSTRNMTIGVGLAVLLMAGLAQATILETSGQVWSNGNMGSAANLINGSAYPFATAGQWNDDPMKIVVNDNAWYPTVYWSQGQTVNSIIAHCMGAGSDSQFYPLGGSPTFQYSTDAWDGVNGSTMTWTSITSTKTYPGLVAFANLTNVRAIRMNMPNVGKSSGGTNGYGAKAMEFWVGGGASSYPGQSLFNAGTLSTTAGKAASKLCDGVTGDQGVWGVVDGQNADLTAKNIYWQEVWGQGVGIDGMVLRGNGADYTVAGLNIYTLKDGADPNSNAYGTDWILQYSDMDQLNLDLRQAMFASTVVTKGVRILLTEAGNNQSFLEEGYFLQGQGAVPEPATLSLLGIAVMAMIRRRKLA